MTIEHFVKNSPPFVVPKGSVPYAKQSIIGLYNEPVCLTSTTSHSNTSVILILPSQLQTTSYEISQRSRLRDYSTATKLRTENICI